MNKKILYDHQIFSLQKYGGISRYFYELINAFSHIDGMDIKTSLIFSNNHYIADSMLVKHFEFIPQKEFRGKQRLMLPFNKIASIQQLKKQNFDVFHPTYYDPYFLNYIGNKPFVLTVYDMIHEKFSDLFSPNDPTTQNKRLLVEKASKIIAISENTKKDLMKLFGTEESKIEVVYLGNSMLLEHTATLTINIPDKYILFVGSRFGYKNFDRFFEAISHLLQKNKDLSLVCAGGGAFKSTDLIHFESLGILDQIHQYDMGDSTLSLLYKHAEVFVFPSLYEGFGIPVLESFACNCPLACSNTSSLPEIAGNGAEYFDPYSVDSIRETVRTILENQNLRDQLIQNGTERLKAFSWEQTALETKKVYEEILS